MTNYSDVRIFLCTTPTKMHYSFDRLMGRAQEIFDASVVKVFICEVGAGMAAPAGPTALEEPHPTTFLSCQGIVFPCSETIDPAISVEQPSHESRQGGGEFFPIR